MSDKKSAASAESPVHEDFEQPETAGDQRADVAPEAVSSDGDHDAAEQRTAPVPGLDDPRAQDDPESQGDPEGGGEPNEQPRTPADSAASAEVEITGSDVPESQGPTEETRDTDSGHEADTSRITEDHDSLDQDVEHQDVVHQDAEVHDAEPLQLSEEDLTEDESPVGLQEEPSISAAAAPQPPAGLGAPQPTAPIVSWIESLGTGTENDTMLRFTPSQHNAIDLTEANNSGLMQLLGGRRTRLSTLLNESTAFETGATAAANIRAKVREMSEERSIDVGYLAAGIASWTETTEAGSSVYTAPVMLIPVSLRTRPDTNDYELQFSAPARLNPALRRHLATVHGLKLDPDEFYATGYATARFDPVRTSELLTRTVSQFVRSLEADGNNHGTAAEEAASPLATLQVWRQIYISTFADLADLGNPHALDTEHPLLQALVSGEKLDQSAAFDDVAALPPLDDRDPADERLIADADADQQAALDAIFSGVSVAVSSPPGTGQTQTAVNAAAGLAWEGKRVLVIAERSDTLAEFSQRLSEAKAGTLAVNVTASLTSDDLRAQVVRAIKRAERAEPPRLASTHQRLTDRRHELRDHVASLHKVRERWQCSPYQAMQALAALTSLNPAPATDVRLKRSVLDNTVDRSSVSVKLKRIAELGAFSTETRHSPWFGARLSNRQETDDAQTLVRRLRQDIPACKNQIETACELVDVTPGETFSDWHSQVLLFQRVQESLGKFSHDIYARDVDDLIAATAPGWWRKQNNVEMSSIARSRLRRVAKEYIRSSVSINDLHGSLVEVQAEREEWQKWAREGSQPRVPKNLDRLVDHLGSVQSRLEKLIRVLAPAEEGKNLFDLPIDDVVETVTALDEDEHSLHTLPERTLLAEQLREQGFAELLDDFAEREVPAMHVADELELAWWQSALEAMISGDEYLAMTTGENLRRIEAEYRAADHAHIASGAQRLNHSLSVQWKSAVEEHPGPASELRTLLREDQPTVASLHSIATDIIQPLIPIWATSPLALAAQFPPSSPEAATTSEHSFDVVLLLDAATLSVPAALGAISRTSQVVAFGDSVSGAPKPMNVSADPIAREAEAQVPDSIYAELAKVLPEYQLRQVHRGVDQELTELLSTQLYSGALTRLPDPAQLTGQRRRIRLQQISGGREPAESPTSEVNRVVDLVFEHIRSHRNRSLAVVTGSERHAKRVADAIRLHLANHPWATSFFEHGAAGVPGGSGSGAAGVGTGEKFVVAPVERAHGIVRDDVILSLGFGRSPRGEATHDFGELSGSRGTEYFAQAVTRARGRLTVVSCISADELDSSRLSGGAPLVRQLLEVLSEATHRQGSANPSASAELTDPLVLDLVDRIRARGGRLEDGFRGTLDLAACPRKINPDNPVTPVAMVSDGTPSYAEQSVRERSRLLPARFQDLGWEYIVLWTIEVFTDPSGATERVAEKVGLSAGPEFASVGRGQLRGNSGPIRFGGAANTDDAEAQRRNKQWPAPGQRRV